LVVQDGPVQDVVTRSPLQEERGFVEFLEENIEEDRHGPPWPPAHAEVWQGLSVASEVEQPEEAREFPFSAAPRVEYPTTVEERGELDVRLPLLVEMK